jgi:ubiquinone/menaquinone biosynthesis C-methylase UbiE
MLDHREIYSRHAARYHQLVSREDYQGNILPALEAIIPLAGLDVVELGAGTGRLTHLLGPKVHSICACDRSAAMLQVARESAGLVERRNWHLVVADHRRLPLAGSTADLVLAGWSICYTVLWHPDTWHRELAQALAEMARVARPGGTLIILETLGTGFRRPRPPAKLRSYYQSLQAAGFATTWIRTDYRFDSNAEAENVVGFFFDESTLSHIEQANQPVLPESTGIWYKTV